MVKNSIEINAGVAKAVGVAGGQAALSRLLGVSPVAVGKYLYINCPAERAVQIEAVTGVSRAEMRPDLWSDQAVDFGAKE